MVMRCAGCRMRAGDCLCELITPTATRTRFTVVLHRKELGKPSNTGQLGHLALINSEVLVHASLDGSQVSLGPADEAYAARYLLFPGTDAIPLEALQDTGRPYHLVVPDGTWAQATRMAKRIPDLARLPRVSVTSRRQSRYVLRCSDEPGRFCTLEAMAAACAVLESQQVADMLDRLLTLMVARTVAWKSSSRQALFAQVQQGS